MTLFLTIYLCAGLSVTLVSFLFGSISTKHGEIPGIVLLLMVLGYLALLAMSVLTWPVLLGAHIYTRLGKAKP